MKNIGVDISTDKKNAEMQNLIPDIGEEPVKSVVYVRFDNGKEYPYYNDKFDLKIGDLVYVDGKLSGELGRVTKVLTKFKISTKYYKNVLRKLNTTFHGKFSKFATFMISKNTEIYFDTIDSWFIPPVVLGEDEEPEEFIWGDGYEYSISDINNGDEFDILEYHKALDILYNNGIKAIAFMEGCGYAIVKGRNIHAVDFTIENGKIQNIHCDCITPDFCRHALAVCLAVSNFIENKIITEDDDFFALDINVFNKFINEVEV